jgi:hypothetical protein
MDAPGASRPNARRRGPVRGCHAPPSTASGVQNAEFTGKPNRGGITPTTSCGTPDNRMVVPTICEFAPNRRCQSE